MKNLPFIYLDAKPPKLERGLVSWSDTWGGVGEYELDFVENNAAWLVYPEQPDNGSNHSHEDHDSIVRAR